MPTRTSYTYSGALLTPADGSTTLALTTSEAQPIEYLERGHIEVWKSTDGFATDENQTQLTRPDDFDISTDGTEIELVTPTVTGESYVVRRVTPLEPYFEFADGSNLTEGQLNRLRLLDLFRAQEAQDFNLDFQDGVDAAEANAAAAVVAVQGAVDDAAAALAALSAVEADAAAAAADAALAQAAASAAQAEALAASSSAQAALDALAGVLPFDLVANVAAIPGSPADLDTVEVTNSTGIESFTPLSGIPGGFVGSSGLSVRIQYNSGGSTWVWLSYFANDPETRYVLQGDAPSAGTGIELTGDYSGLTIALTSGAQTSLGKADTAVQPGRTISAGTGLAGGGDLSANRTLSLSSGTQDSLALADSAYQASDLADQATAEAGTSNTTLMTPLRTAEQVAAKPPGIPVSSKNAAYTLADADTGKVISITTGGVTVPDTLASGTSVCIFNNSGSSQVIVQASGLTLYWGQSGATGNRTLAGRGVATVLQISSGVAVITGAGLT